MASRQQKSFFDQSHNNSHHSYPKRKSKDTWFAGATSKPTKNAGDNRAEPRSNNAMAPIPASTSSRRKLKAYQFIEGAPPEDRALYTVDKENVAVATSRRSYTDPEQFKDSPIRPRMQNDPLSRAPPPSTPATRLPLADLLGNPEDTLPRLPPIAGTPEDGVVWRTHKSPIKIPLYVDTPARKRRRANSSSPVLSQYQTNVAPNTTALRTPQADPATDIWDRYATMGGNVDAATSQFAHLIRDSSPPVPAEVSSVSGLRRWATCGVAWPTSRSKRRKSRANTYIRPEDDQSLLEEVEAGTETGPTSRVSDLIERMRATKRDNTRERQPASSSPLPEPQAYTGATSPLHRMGTAEQPQGIEAEPGFDAVDEDADMMNQAAEADPEIQDDQLQEEVAIDQTLEYQDLDSDDGFGDDFDEVAAAGLNLQDIGVAFDETGPVPDDAVLSHQEQVNTTEDNADMVAAPPPPALVKITSDDDFGSDGDVFADVEQIMSAYDSQAVPPAPTAQELMFTAPESAGGAANAPIELSDDEFGDDDDIDMDQLLAVESALSQVQSGEQQLRRGSSDVGKRKIQRYLVKQIEESSYIEADGIPQPEKILIVEDEKTRLFKDVILRQSWWDTTCPLGSYIHIIGDFDSANRCIVDDHHNMVILHPDHLISATSVADSFGCMRRAVLQQRVKATSQASAPLLFGSVLHELMQDALTANRWDDAFFESSMDAVLPKHYEAIVEINYNLDQVREHLRSKLPELQGWANLFLQTQPRSDAIVKARGNKQLTASVNKLLDVEEHVWSPMYGLKGNIDATVQVVVDEKGQRQTLTVPFEIKTGKNRSESHTAQTALYTLLMSDRYDLDVQYGFLYYLEHSEMSRVQAVRHEIIHMIMKRNELAGFIRGRTELPPPLTRSHLCKGCYAQTTCFLYHKLGENGVGETTALKDKFNELVKYLKIPDQEFFQKWESLITKEEGEMMKFRRELWTMLSSEREQLGRCFSDLIVELHHSENSDEGSKINRYHYAFTKRQPTEAFSFAESQIAVGEPVVISDEEGHFALANGYVTGISKRRIRVAVDRRLHNSRVRQPDFDPIDNQTFAGIMDIEGSASSARRSLPSSDHPSISYRLDKDEFSNGMANIRNNLLQIMDDSVFKAVDLRALIINNRAPKFRAESETKVSQSWQSGMNSDQKAAVSKVMTAEEYALVLGMPGTGKTTTIAQIIETLVAKGKSVLLTSYTHTAVDNILLKFKGERIDILRLGVVAKIHPEVQEFAILAAQPKNSLEELRDSWHRPQVVATTCLGLNHPLFTQRTFDVCIVDEASQVTLPVCLGPIRMAKTFVLVGDHYQLPPLVQNKEAVEGGLDVSLFRLLSERQPQAVVNLEHQYRMCADIMMLANELVYDGRLKCGNEAVAIRSLELPSPGAAQKYHLQSRFTTVAIPKTVCRSHQSLDCHLNAVLDPSRKVIFLNTDTLGPAGRESLSGNRITNASELALTSQLVYLYMAAGIVPSELGVMTFYRSQLGLLRQSLRSATVPVSEVELHTADKFQGRDKEAVIASFVRNNENGEIGELLKDWRRINVAITRAKSKLILIGSKKTLTAQEGVLKGMVEICERQGWIIDLQPGVLEAHFFPEMSGSQLDTQLSPMKPPGKTRVPMISPTARQAGNSPLKGRGVVRASQSVDTEGAALAAVSGNRGGSRPIASSTASGTAGPKGKSVHAAFKAPSRVGKVNAEKVLKKRGMVQDVLNELL